MNRIASTNEGEYDVDEDDVEDDAEKAPTRLEV
jgi:hypothetical protein